VNPTTWKVATVAINTVAPDDFAYGQSGCYFLDDANDSRYIALATPTGTIRTPYNDAADQVDTPLNLNGNSLMLLTTNRLSTKAYVHEFNAATLRATKTVQLPGITFSTVVDSTGILALNEVDWKLIDHYQNWSWVGVLARVNPKTGAETKLGSFPDAQQLYDNGTLSALAQVGSEYYLYRLS
jgi:hypothetical protein